MTSTGWTELAGLQPELLALAERCLAADGGLPLAADPDFLGRRWAGESVSAFGLPAADGSLLAAGAVRLTPSGPAFTGLVDPTARGRGLGSDLLDYGLALAATDSAPTGAHAAGARAAGAHAAGAHGSGADSGGAYSAGADGGGAHAVGADGEGADGGGAHAVGADGEGADAGGADAVGAYGGGTDAVGADGGGAHVVRDPGEGAVTVESETLTDDAVALFASRGLRQVFAEDVMRIDLTGTALPRAVWPAGAILVSWSGSVARRFHATYHASFRDRPGFPAEPADDWIAENDDDADFLPDCSLLVTVPGLGDAGFITAARDWVVQVGVAPTARRRGLAAALITESLARMRASGGTHAWLTVNVNNPGAADLYRRLGFTHHGRRARFQP